MKMFIDTANVDQIREANDLGVICGVTTNLFPDCKRRQRFRRSCKRNHNYRGWSHQCGSYQPGS